VDKGLNTICNDYAEDLNMKILVLKTKGLVRFGMHEVAHETKNLYHVYVPKINRHVGILKDKWYCIKLW
jgi:hypothetical protein